jgi:predicted HicB family RNase H-like nuclease
MKPELHYKGYVGSVEVDLEGNAIVGKLLFIADVIAYSAGSPAGIEAAFREAVDEYIQVSGDIGHAFRASRPPVTW